MPVSDLKDKVFSGIKYAINKNGSICMHAELMQDTKDNFCPKECLLDPAVLRSSLASVASPR
eukprot:11045032-Ditylum_brightwellii.AAC.1